MCYTYVSTICITPPGGENEDLVVANTGSDMIVGTKIDGAVGQDWLRIDEDM